MRQMVSAHRKQRFHQYERRGSTWSFAKIHLHYGDRRDGKMNKLIATFCLLFAAGIASAQGTYTAASCNYSDVNAVINGPKHTAVNGDTIVIPAGTCTWTNGISRSGVGITIKGQGTPNTGPSTTGAGTSTTILIQNTNSSLFAFSGVPYGQLMRYSMMYLEPQSGATSEAVPIETEGTCTSNGCPNIRVDNVTFDPAYNNDPANSDTVSVNMFGVYDHDTFQGPGTGVGPASVQISFDAWQGIGSNGDESFAAPDSTGTAQALFQENNLYNGARGSENDVGFSGLGGDRYVNRYNISNNTPGTGFFSDHGTAWTGRDRGSRQKEIYRNQINCSSSVGSCGGGNFLSGTGYVFDNTFASSGTGFFNQYMSIDSPRRWRAAAVWGSCAGADVYDQNDGTVYGSGTITSGGTSGITNTVLSLVANVLAGTAVTSGDPYSIYDTTQKLGGEIASNSSNSFTFAEALYGQTMNSGDSYQVLRASVCLDQPGRSQGTYLSGTSGPNGGPTPTGWSNQVLDPIYEFGDTHSGNFGAPVNISTASILANRDIYYEVSTSANSSPTSPFNGSTGTGFGTLANRPTSCTPGVAYWATDQGNWNLAGGEQGELFKCTATNTWTLSYTPYTYPHPLTSASTVQPAAPTGLSGTVTTVP